ncbi:Hydroxypyruvate reductase [compost metagenome]
MAFRVLVSTRFFDQATEQYLREQGCEVVRTGLADDIQDDVLDPARLIELLEGVDGWIVGTAPVTRELLAKHPSIKVIARRGVGHDTVDTVAAKDLGRVVTIAPGGNEPAVADHTVAMMLGVAKRLREAHQALQAGKWQPLTSGELYQKTVGLVGFGRIARAVAKRVAGFDARIITYDPFPNNAVAAELGVEFLDLDRLLAESDYISLHLPLNEKTRHLIGQSAFSRMKSTAILVNTSRGGLVDEEALHAALVDRRLGGAGIDVFEGEADQSKRGIAERLVSLPNVIASAHAAGSSEEGLQRTNRIAAQAVLAVLRGGDPDKHCIVVDGRGLDKG